jgi:cardiolipin synthase A/B
MVGSANLDVRSMRLNFELNAFVRDPATAAALERVLTKDMESSRHIVPEEFARRSRWQRWKESMVRPLGPLT